MKNIIQAVVISIILTSGTTGIAYLLGWDISSITLIEYLGVFLSYASTWLCVKQSASNFYFGILAVISYSILFYNLGLYASMSLQLVLLPILVFGLYQWKTKKESKTGNVKFNTLFIIAVASLAITSITVSANGNMPVLDSLIFFLSLIANYLLIIKKVENWIVWMIVNVISIIVYYQSGAYLATLQYVLFLVNAFYGYYAWKKVMKNEN